jgi:hypothetical protein
MLRGRYASIHIDEARLIPTSTMNSAASTSAAYGAPSICVTRRLCARCFEPYHSHHMCMMYETPLLRPTAWKLRRQETV